MTHAQNYPGANRTVQWGGTGRPNMSKIDKVLLHTTETQSWPGYGSFYPTLTFNPWLARGSRWRQHYPIGDAATTLSNSGSYQTNRANVIQVEIVAYADGTIAKKYGHDVRDIPSDALRELGEFIAWMHKEWEVPISSTVQWKAYPASYGSNGVRLSTAQFTNYKGVLGHMHAPGNSHGDPGSLNIDAIMAAAKGDVISTPVWDGKSFPGADKFYIGANAPYITFLGQRLVAHGWTGYLEGPGPNFGPADQAGVKWFQEKQGWTGSDADGIPGEITWGLLFSDPQPVVIPKPPVDPPAPVDPEPVPPVEEPPVVIPPTEEPPVVTPPVVIPPKPEVKPGIKPTIGVAFNARWPGFKSSTGKSWSSRVKIIATKVKAQKPRLIMTQEMGKTEAADFYKEMGSNWHYDRFGPLNTVGWDTKYFEYKKTLEIDTPDYGQYPGRGYVESWLKDGNGNRLRLGSGHNPVKTAADGKYQEQTVQQIVSGVNNEEDDWPLVWSMDTNNRQSKDTGMWKVLTKYGYKWINSSIDYVFSNFGAKVKKLKVVDLGDVSDHDMLVFEVSTTKK